MRAHPIYLMLAVLSPVSLAAADAPDFSGTWTLDAEQSHLRGLPSAPSATLTITQQGSTVSYAAADVIRSFTVDGHEAQWQDLALVIETPVGQDRWELSGDRALLTITRTIRRDAATVEATLIYRNERRVDPPGPVIIKPGTKILLSLISSLNTKRSAEGDRVYLETAFPIAQNGRIVIPKGSYVAGTVTEVKRPGQMKGKAELYLRFDSLTLPNGVTRDFLSRLDSADGKDVDRQEGKISGDSNKTADARTVGETAGAGAAVGSIAGSVAGHAGMGAGIGAIAGAAAGLAVVLLTRGPEVILPKGTTLEMVLDRELQYDPRELTAAAAKR